MVPKGGQSGVGCSRGVAGLQSPLPAGEPNDVFPQRRLFAAGECEWGLGKGRGGCRGLRG